MAGTKAGGIAAAITNKQKFGADFYSKIGTKGGGAQVPKGFAKNRDLASRAGMLGGTRSRRGKAADA